MDNYEKAYALLVGQIDEALTLLDTDNLLEFGHVKEILQTALEDAEEIFLSDENYGETHWPEPINLDTALPR